MKRIQLLAALLLLLANHLYARGGCGGHGSCGHGHGGGGFYGAHASGSDDVFLDLRTKICYGYIVYKGDTQRGVIVCADNILSLKAGPLQDSTFRCSSKDTNLTAAALTDSNETICLKRLHDKRLYEVYHTGRLNVYADYFSFDLCSKKLYEHRVKTAHDGYSYKLNGISTKRELVAEVNKAYSLNLSPHDYSKRSLLQYVSKLD